jgi:ribonuclease HII|tara:strand:- start:3152 stop:3688 length:537 start_codon:yes stop_codon:yes gene_type:complete
MIAGVDEVGRGCLAGPVIAASVILKRPIKGLMDSKRLSSKKREDLSQIIIKNSIFAIGAADSQEIDQINILQASLLAMQRSLEKLDMQPKKVLVDGNHIFETSIEIEAIVGGDNLIPSISAASILAKVFRDRLMMAYSKEFPNYGLDKHKGYPTKLHKEMLKKYGLTRIHRRTFKGVN